MWNKKILSSVFALGLSLFAMSEVDASLNIEASDKVLSEKIVNFEGKQVNVKHLEKREGLTSEKALGIVNKASLAVKEEKAKDKQNKSNSANGTYNFISGDDNYTYVYEETRDDVPTLTITDSFNTESTNNIGILSVGTNFLTDGIGGKQSITLTNSTYMSTLLKLPTSADAGSWNYGGFDYNSGTAQYSGEMGLQYSSSLGTYFNLKGWKPSLILVKIAGGVKTKYTVGFDSNYQDVQYRNGYIEGANINYYTYYNYNGYVRMKLTGTALCKDLNCNNTTPTTLTTIIQTAQTVNLSTINNYKLATTIVTTNTTGNNKGIFSNIKVGTTAVGSSYFAPPLVDHATITRDANNTVTIDID